MTEQRYDLVWREHWRGPYITQHFCGECEWDEDGGCYGFNPDHGMSFEEAKREVVEWWQGVSEGHLFPETVSDD